MPKGRRANPSTTRDGIWFKQCGHVQIYPESLTATMQKQIFNIDPNCQTGKNVPLAYKEREKNPEALAELSIPIKNCSLLRFLFLSKANKDYVIWSDRHNSRMPRAISTKLGTQMTYPLETNTVRKPVNTFPFSIHDNRHCLLSMGEYLDSGLGVRKFQDQRQHYSQNYYFLAHEQIPSSNAYHSVYQTSFVQYPDIKHSILARFPKNHIDKCIALHSAPKNDYMWFSKYYTGSNHIAPTEATKSSEPEKLSAAEEEIK